MNEHIHIRLALALDILAVSIIAQTAYAPYIQRIGCKPAPMKDDYEKLIAVGSLWVILRLNMIAGFIVLQEKSDHLLVSNIAVAPPHQGVGLGRALLDYAEACARQRGFRDLRLYTNEKMYENLELYSKLGWLEYNRAEQDGFQRGFLQKCLSDSISK